MRKALNLVLIFILFALLLLPSSFALSEGQVVAMVSDAIKSYALDKHNDWAFDEVKVTFRYADSTFAALTQRPGKIGFAVAEVYSNFDPVGDVYVPVQVFVDGKKAEIVYVRAKVEVWKDIVVTSQRLSRGAVISAGDILLSKKDVGLIPLRYFVDQKDIIGKEIVSSISGGIVIQDWMVRVPPAVKKNEDVTIIAELPTLMVTAKGTALEDGYEGDNIKVRNNDTKKELRAVVLKDGKVQVNLD
jgi:flagella basal body P-ring formation protein FlgA